MALVSKVELRTKVSIIETIKFQILTYCFFNNIQIGLSDLKCLTELAQIESIELPLFTISMVDKNVFKSSQSARNSITKIIKLGLISSTGTNPKRIMLSSVINVQNKGLVLLDYKILGNESPEA